MFVKQLEDPEAFLDAAAPLLLADEARNNLILGIAGTLRDHPGVYDEYGLWLVESKHRVVAAALQTPPYNLVLAGPAGPEALAALAEALHAKALDLPGATGSVPEIETFARIWATQVGVDRRRRMTQRIYRLTELQAVREVSGRPRPATEADRPLLAEWLSAFAGEVMPKDAPNRGSERIIEARLGEGAGGFTIWDVGEPVSLAGWGGLTPNGVRIGPAYTPPEHRRCG